MGEEEKKELEVNEDGSATLILEEKPEEVLEEKEPAEKPEDVKAEPEEKIIPNEEAARRRINYEKAQLKRENEWLKDELAKHQKKEPSEKVTEDLETDLSKKPISTIKEISRKEAEELYNRKRAEDDYIRNYEKVLSESQARVVKKHPELENDSSVKAQVMRKVLDRNPHLTQRAEGPLLAMIEMEDELEKRGLLKKEFVKNDKIPVSSLPSPRNVPKTKTVTLTKEQLDFCKENKINPKDYAMRLMMFSKGVEGVEV